VKAIVPILVKRAAGILAAIAIAIVVILIGLGSVVRLVVCLALVYGGLSLAGSLVERIWQIAHRAAVKHRATFPRFAAVTIVGLVLFVIALTFTVIGGTQLGKMLTNVILGGLLLIGGFLTLRRWIAALCERTAALFHKRAVSRGEA
jgi:hypothetical protein